MHGIFSREVSREGGKMKRICIEYDNEYDVSVGISGTIYIIHGGERIPITSEILEKLLEAVKELEGQA